MTQPIVNPSKLPEYYVWKAARSRCYKPHNPSYKNYGGRGITMCDEWRESFAAFIRDMGRRPSDRHTIERRNNDGPYSKVNCYWATMLEQANNTRWNRRLTVYGESDTVSGWSRRYRIGKGTISTRLRKGCSPEEAVTKPIADKRAPVTFNGKTQLLANWARELGVNFNTIHERLRRGWSAEKALTTPVGKYERGR